MYDVAIVGGGIAGITAALYAKRANLKIVLIEKLTIGGQLSFIDTVENYPGFSRISGREFTNALSAQIKALSVEVIRENVVSVKNDKKVFEISTRKNAVLAKALIIATGASPRSLGVKGEKELAGKGVSYCAVCDGFFFKDKKVSVIGGGNTALEEALYLSSIAKEVYVIHRRNEFRGFPLLSEKVRNTDNIILLMDSVLKEIKGSQKVEELSVENVKSKKITLINTDGVFIAVGYAPSTEFLKGFLSLDEQGFIVTDSGYMTSEKGVFACGDCRKRNVKQLITAASEGAEAAINAYNYLKTS